METVNGVFFWNMKIGLVEIKKCGVYSYKSWEIQEVLKAFQNKGS